MSTMELSAALEDYLETIYLLVATGKVARVRDIARARNVKPGSVSPAMRRLRDLGLIRYVQREYIDLTDDGADVARRVIARHRVLTRFFIDVLQMTPEGAEADACAIEHSLSNEAMDRMVRLFEFMQVCPEGKSGFLERFHACPLADPTKPDCGRSCARGGGLARRKDEWTSLRDLGPGERGRVMRVDARGAVRQRLLDMGLLPGVTVTMERLAPAGDPVWLKIQRTRLALRKAEAEAVMVEKESSE